jgi:hypothetical protein
MTRARRLLVGATAIGVLIAGVGLVNANPASAIDVSTEAELRAAFADVNQTEITLTADITLTDCTAGGGDLDRVDGQPLRLLGQQFTIEQTCADEGVIELEGTNVVSINDVTITGGDKLGLGGGIYTRNGDLTVVNSSIVDNDAAGSGGGINGDFTNITISRSTISGNSAANTGGVYTNGFIQMFQSTVTGNTSSNNTGGVRADGDITLTYSTVVGNTGPEGANVATQSEGEGLFGFGSVVALPFGGGENCSLTEATTSLGYNYSDDSSCGYSGEGDIQDGANPQLAALAANGGATLTRMPQPGSPLIDRIPVGTACPDGLDGTDQRGVERPIGPGCDVGSVEAPLPQSPSSTGTTQPGSAAATSPRFTG